MSDRSTMLLLGFTGSLFINNNNNNNNSNNNDDDDDDDDDDDGDDDVKSHPRNPSCTDYKGVCVSRFHL